MVTALDNDQKPQSRRDLGKAQTRQALIDAALTLFASNGYDQTTAEAIAEQAGVSARTFFRHFPTKESVLFLGEDDFYRVFVADLDAQPKSLSDLAAVSAAFVSVAPVVEARRTRIKQYRQATATSSTLRGQEQKHRDRHVAEVAQALARRRGSRRPDNSCRVLAVVATTVFELAIGDWATGPARARLTAVVADRFALLEGLPA